MVSVREAERTRKLYERAAAAEEKERKRLYLEAQLAEVEVMNEELAAEVASLEGLLASTLDVDDYLDFETLKDELDVPPFQPGALAVALSPPLLNDFLPPPLSGMAKLVPGAKAKHEQAVEAATESFETAKLDHATRVAERDAALAAARIEYEADVEKIRARVTAQHEEIDEFRESFVVGDPDAIVTYFSLVLDASSYPEDFREEAQDGVCAGVEAARR